MDKFPYTLYHNFLEAATISFFMNRRKNRLFTGQNRQYILRSQGNNKNSSKPFSETKMKKFQKNYLSRAEFGANNHKILRIFH
jgi:hypothetical protein